MGNFNARPLDPQFESACRRFSAKELKDLRALFTSLAAQSRSHGQFIIASVFQAYFGIHGCLGARMFDVVTRMRKDQKLTYEDLVIAKGTYKKGSREEIENFMYQLIDLTGDGLVDRSELEAVIISVLETVLSPEEAVIEGSLSEDNIQIFLNTANFSLASECEGGQSMSFEDFKKWCNLVPSLKKFLGSLMTTPGSGISGRQTPQLMYSENVNPDSVIMRKEYAWHIAGALQQHEALQWNLLYHSSVDGLSFTTFLGKLAVARGSTILLIKDKEGYIYGGYASQMWEKHNDFYGDMKSCLFSLFPQAAIYRPTGANSNLQWCAINFTSNRIPNGIGFGGQVNHFGLFLSGTFERGHSFKCITYDSPCLSRTTDIFPESIECWGVVTEGVEQEKLNTTKGTVLERFKEDRNMLNMVGIANACE